MIKKIIQSAYLNLLTGIILLLTSGYEILGNLGEHTMGAQHGIAFFAIIQIVKSFPEIMHGLQEIEKAKAIKRKLK